MILDKIVEQKRLQLNDEMKQISIEGWKDRLKRTGLHRTMDFFGALKGKGRPSIIAEVKKASPSKGIIKDSFEPLEIAKEYCSAEVEAVSVLTERHFFLGNDNDLVKIRQAYPVPILRKDFILEAWQVYQSRMLGADAVLLIAAILTRDQLKKLQVVAGILGLQCLVEVHNREELDNALEAGARMIGINNRNLKTFEVNLKTTESLINHIPHDRLVVSESGIRTAEEMKYLQSLGVDAVLIGETLMRAESIGEKIRELRVC